LTEGILFWAFPKEVVARLFDRSGWSRKQVVFTVLGKLCALVCLLLIIFTPLKIGAPVFVVGLVIVALGLIGFVKALFDFKNTPLDQPVTRGIYRISRHPQIFTASVMILGSCIAVGSWLALILLLVARAFSHFGILAEEEVCLKQYGDAYQAYMNRVPRYFLFF
jgi:protein-S-isoprenylcysteine O-methyltransferase Ste14